MSLPAVLLLITLRLIPNEVLCMCRRLMHPSAWRNCLENSWKASGRYVVGSRRGRRVVYLPLLAALQAPLRDSFRISKQFLHALRRIGHGEGPRLRYALAPVRYAAL